LSDLYYIMETTTWVGDHVLFWRPESKGYTTDLDKAGRYTKEEAQKIEAVRGTDKALPCELVDRHAVRGLMESGLAKVRKDDLHLTPSPG
jgi:hypothetical protein